MTDQTVPTDRVRKIIARYRDGANDQGGRILADLKDLLPPPTLADMTPAARRECQWMQCEVNGDRRAIILIRDDRDHNHAVTLDPYGHTAHCPFERVTPRPDLPRMEWSDKNPDPAPTLPDGWRFADHEKHGRVIVTNPTPDCYGTVYFAFPRVDYLNGFDWKFCDPDELTYLD